MFSVEAAQGLAFNLLADELPRRWSHVQGVAEQVAVTFGDTAETPDLVVAAWLHDIGYASSLVETGFHPIDGARYLRRAGADEAVVGLVAHHSCARIEAELKGLASIFAEEFPRDESLPHDELCFCDMTTSPDGELVTVEERLAEIRERYGAGHVVSQFVDLAEHELVATVRRVEAQIAGPGQPR